MRPHVGGQKIRMITHKEGDPLAGPQSPGHESGPEALGPCAKTAVGDLLPFEAQAELLGGALSIRYERLRDRSQTPLTRAHEFPPTSRGRYAENKGTSQLGARATRTEKYRATAPDPPLLTCLATGPMLGEDGRGTLAGLRWRGRGTPQRRLPDVQLTFRDLDHERFLHGSATLSGRGGDGRRRHEVPGFLPRRPAAGYAGHRDDGHPLPGFLLERLRVRGDLLRPQQPDPSYRRPAKHADRPELGPALSDRHDRRAPHDGRRPRRQTLPGSGPHARRGNRRVSTRKDLLHAKQSGRHARYSRRQIRGRPRSRARAEGGSGRDTGRGSLRVRRPLLRIGPHRLVRCQRAAYPGPRINGYGRGPRRGRDQARGGRARHPGARRP